MPALNIINSAQTDRDAPIVCTLMEDNQICFFVDYCKLNAITEKGTYSATSGDNRIYSLGKETVFSALGANSGYCQGKKKLARSF